MHEPTKPKLAPILVTAAAIVNAGEVLIAQRKSDASVEADRWEFPGGKLEFGETPEECLKREIYEELNLEIKVGTLIGIASHVYQHPTKPVHVVLLCYRCRLVGSRQDLQNRAVQDSRWITAAEANRYRFAAADLPLLEKGLRVESDT